MLWTQQVQSSTESVCWNVNNSILSSLCYCIGIISNWPMKWHCYSKLRHSRKSSKQVRWPARERYRQWETDKPRGGETFAVGKGPITLILSMCLCASTRCLHDSNRHSNLLKLGQSKGKVHTKFCTKKLNYSDQVCWIPTVAYNEYECWINSWLGPGYSPVCFLLSCFFLFLKWNYN